MINTKILNQHRNDYTAEMICEHCNAKSINKRGYADNNYLVNVIPSMYCQSCGKNRAGELSKIPMNVSSLNIKIGSKYNWKDQPERLIYIGKEGSWHQFNKIGDPREVWCEVLDCDLHMLEETKQVAND